MEADEYDGARPVASGRWAARRAILQHQLNELTASLSLDGSPCNLHARDVERVTGTERSAPWPPTAMSLSSDRLPYSFKLLHHDDLPSPRWQAGLLGPTPAPDYPTIPGMPGWAREPLLPLPEPEPTPPRPVGVGFREHIEGENLLNYLGEVLQSPSTKSRKHRVDSNEQFEDYRPQTVGTGSDENYDNQDDPDVDDMPRGTIARARWRYRQKEMRLAMSRIQSASEPEVEPEPEPEPAPQPEHEPETDLLPEVEPEPEVQPQRASPWPLRPYSSPEKNETHAQWEDKNEHAICGRITAAVGALNDTTETPVANTSTLIPKSSFQTVEKHRLLTPLPPKKPIPPATPTTAKDVLAKVVSPVNNWRAKSGGHAAAVKLQAVYRGHLVRHTGDVLPELLVERLEARRREEEQHRSDLLVAAESVAAAEQRLVAAEQAQALARAAYERAKKAAAAVRAPLHGLRHAHAEALSAATKAETRAVQAEKAVLAEEQWRVKRNERMVIGDRKRRLTAAKAEVEERKIERQEAIRALHSFERSLF